MAARGRIVFVLVLAVACAAGSALAAPHRSAVRTLYVDGDSLAVGTGWYLSTLLPGWTLRGTVAVSRHASQGAFAVEERAREGLLERVVVVDLGTNDDPSAVSRFREHIRWRREICLAGQRESRATRRSSSPAIDRTRSRAPVRRSR